MNWQDKAHRIITALCYGSWKQANTRKNGARYKKHRAYSVPTLAENLTECLGTNDEERAKALFLSYDGIKAYRETS